MAWKKVLSREGLDVTIISFIDEIVYQHASKFLKENKEFLFTLCHQRQITHYVNIDILELERWLYKQHFSSIPQIEKHYAFGQTFLAEAQTTAQELKTHNDLLAAFNTFVSQYTIINDIYSITSFFAIDAWQADFEAVLNQLIEQRGLQAHKAEIIEVLYTPWKDTAIRLAEQEINAGVASEEVAEKYQFLRSCSVVWYRPLDAGWAKNLKTSGQVEHHNKLSREQALQLLQPDESQRVWLDLAPYIIFFKDWRDDVRRAHVFAWAWLFERIGQHFGVKADDCGYLTKEELEQALRDDEWPTATVERRKKYPCVVTARMPELKIIVKDQDVSNYLSIIDQVLAQSQQTTIKGLVAQAGKATGKVVIVKTYHDIKHVEEGDVLVANTTHPTYLPGMKKAVAFVTNEGGIISHAAIMAREMLKPCIVGTKNATTLLRNGDLVEVDGTTGQVRVLRKSN